MAVRKFHKLVALVLLAPMICSGSGCALIFNQRKQTIRINTTPPGRTVYVKSQAVQDGQSVTLTKDFHAAEANVGTPSRPIPVELKYNPDIWLVGDAALLLVFVIPGLIALGIDFGSGAWRTYENPQILVVPDQGGSPAPRPVTTPAPTPGSSPTKKATPKPAPKPPTKTPAPAPPADPPEPEPSPIQP